MLQNIHDKLKGWFAGIILGFVSLTFAMWGISNYFDHAPTKKVIAKVNGTKITEQQLNDAYKALQQQQQARGIKLTMTPEIEKAMKQQVLQGLIQQAVLVQGAKDAKFSISQQQVDAALAQVPAFQVNGQFSPQRLMLALSNLGLSEQQYLQQLQDELLINQLQAAFLASSFALPAEVNQLVQLVDQKRNISYAILNKNTVKQKQRVTQQQITSYYQSHKESFKIPAKVKLAYVKLSINDVAKKIKPTATEIKEYYTANKNMFNSDGKQQSLIDATPQISHIIAKRKAQQLFASQSDQLANLSYENPNSLDAVAKALGLTVKTTDYISKQGAKSGLGANKNVLAQAFSDDVYNQGYNSNVINLDDGQQLVIRVAAKQAATYKPIADVTNQIVQQIQAANESAILQQQAKQIADKIKAGTHPEQLQQQYQLQWHQQTQLSRDSKLAPRIIQTAFALATPEAHKQSAGFVGLANGNYAVVVLHKVIPGQTKNANSKEKASFKQQIATSYGNLDFQLYTQSLMKDAKIKMNK